MFALENKKKTWNSKKDQNNLPKYFSCRRKTSTNKGQLKGEIASKIQFSPDKFVP